MSIRSEMKSGVLWTAINKYSSLLISLLITTILSRLISPEEFGVVAIAQVVITFLNIFSDFGIGPAIIQNKKLSNRDLSSIFTITIFVGLFLTALLIISSKYIGAYYDNAQLEDICKILSISLLFNALNIVPGNIFYRNKQFKILAKRNLVLQILAGIAAIIYALNGGGCYALVLQSVVSSALSFFISIYYNPQKIVFDFHPMRAIASFSLFQFCFTLLNFFSRQIDKLIIGKYLTLQDLGYYQKSYALMLQPLDKISDVITPVIQPILSDYQDQKQFIADKYIQILRIISLISFPLGIMLCVCGPEVIRIMFGENWDGAVRCFQILTLSLPLQMLCTTTGSIYQSCNATKYMFYTGIMTSVFTVSSFLFAAIYFGSIEAIAIAWNFAIIFSTLVNFICLFKFILKTSLSAVIKRLVHPVSLFLLLGVVFYILYPLLKYEFLINFIIKAFIGSAIIFIYYYIFGIVRISDIKKLIKK